jgi:hypothetical protein
MHAYLSPFEALLLDLALASRDDATPWLTFEEAHRLFGEHADTAKAELEHARRGLASVAARLVAVIGLFGSVTSWFVMRDLDIAGDVRYPAAAALASLLFAIAVAVAARERTPGLVADAAGSFFVACAIIAGFIAVNNAPKKALIGGVSGVAADVLIAAGGVVIWAIVVVALRARRPTSSV